MHHAFLPIPLSIRLGEPSVTPASTLSARGVRVLRSGLNIWQKDGWQKTIFLIFLPSIFLPARLGISDSHSTPRPGVRVLLPSFSCQQSQNMTRRGIARFGPCWQTGGTLWPAKAPCRHVGVALSHAKAPCRHVGVALSHAKAPCRHVGVALLHAKHPSRRVGGTLLHEKAFFRRFGGFSPGAGSRCRRPFPCFAGVEIGILPETHSFFY